MQIRSTHALGPLRASAHGLQLFRPPIASVRDDVCANECGHGICMYSCLCSRQLHNNITGEQYRCIHLGHNNGGGCNLMHVWVWCRWCAGSNCDLLHLHGHSYRGQFVDTKPIGNIILVPTYARYPSCSILRHCLFSVVCSSPGSAPLLLLYSLVLL
jgi:hypothetical protein